MPEREVRKALHKVQVLKVWLGYQAHVKSNTTEH